MIWESGGVGTVFGALLAIAFTMLVEWLRKPSLTQSIEVQPLDTAPNNPIAKNMRALRINVFSKPLPRFARWMMRSPASRCRGTISFHHLDGQDVFGRVMEGRWANTPEPARLAGIDAATGRLISVLDPERLGTPSRIDIFPGQVQPLDVVARFDDDADCYGWNNDSYAHQWRNPAWRLPPGRYLIRVTVTSSGQSWSTVFRLINDVPRTDFRLIPASRKDRRRITLA
jgi:hypothetical protein